MNRKLHVPTSEEWQRARGAEELAYHVTTHLKGVRSALFWRSP